MNHFERVEYFSDELRHRLNKLYLDLDPKDRNIFNDPELWFTCWQAFIQTSRPFGLLYSNQEKILGAGFFRHDSVMIFGKKSQCIVPMTYPSDFTSFLVHSEIRESFIKGLSIELLRHGPIIMLSRLTKQDYDLLSNEGRHCLLYQTIGNPICLNEERSFQEVIRKKSHVRYTNWFKQNGKLCISHSSKPVTAKQWNFWVKYQIERWAFDNIDSFLCDSNSQLLYRNLFTQYAKRPGSGNAVIATLVQFNSEPVAMHFGLRWGETLLYAIPVINIKYLEHSPGQLLIRSVFEYAIQAGLKRFDLGIGEETYKSRYATKRLEYRTYLVFSSKTQAFLTQVLLNLVKAPLLVFLCAWFKKGLCRWRLLEALWNKRNKKEMRETLKAMVTSYLNPYREIVIYSPHQYDKPYGQEMVELTFADYVSHVRQVHTAPYPLKRYVYERFRKGYRLFALQTSGQIVCYAWIHKAPELYVPEVSRTLIVQEESYWIVDGITPSVYRGKGYISTLLRHLTALLVDKNVFIYALSRNRASLKAIRKGGFLEIGRIVSVFGIISIKRGFVRDGTFRVTQRHRSKITAL